MKRLVVWILGAMSLAFSVPSMALDGEGTIEELIVCNMNDAYWKSLLLFRLSDGNWFGVYGHFYYNTDTHYSGDSLGQGMIMMAHSRNLAVKVKANYSSTTRCGVTAQLIWDTNGDYIHVLPD